MTPFLNPTYIISILIAISVHEWAHAVTAHRLGDPTAEREGRLTLNPLSHLDPIGALMFLFVGFGWARPVPVNPAFFRHPKRDMAITALAGPVSNLILAFIAFTILALLTNAQSLSIFDLLDPGNGLSPGMKVATQILGSSLFVNLGLMAFNLFPLPPLDGSNILRMFIPYRLEDRYEEIMRVGPFILLALILFESILPIPLLSGWVHGIMGAVLWVFGVTIGSIL